MHEPSNDYMNKLIENLMTFTLGKGIGNKGFYHIYLDGSFYINHGRQEFKFEPKDESVSLYKYDGSVRKNLKIILT